MITDRATNQGNYVSRDRDTENVSKCEWSLLAERRPSAFELIAR